MHKLGVEEWLVSAVMFMYTGAKTVVITIYGNGNDFEVKVSMHQGSMFLLVLAHPGCPRQNRYSRKTVVRACVCQNFYLI